MSRYGSESLLNSIDAMAAEGTYANADRKGFVRRRLPRQASSDDLSTPNSGRSRSSSIISSDFIPEECEDDRSNGDVTCGSGGPSYMNMPSKTDVDIEKVCQLVQDLKEQDLFHHRQRIVEKELRSQESKHYPEVSLGAESHSVPTPKHCGVGIVPTIKTIFNQPEIRVSLKADGNTGWKVAAQSNKVENESETHHEMNTMRQKHQMARESFFGVMMKGEEVCQITNQASTASKEWGNNKQKNSDHLSQPSKSNGTSSPTQGSSSCPTTPIQIRK
ncbi:uncharacterized protein LOC131892092 [Tigriopus californicus]|uniref:uncharacterized protein LOC131892092 n=1 Tax=Tigriopus californicus TaxID=6832 RepID=UPI0027DA9CB2|nr:uncharacterized protein LOC131892092 [Tigriopus californicus]